MDKIGLYVHWPYCSRICPYCDFNIYKNKSENEEALIEAILVDMRYWREKSGARELVSIHFGGGTPSLLSARNLNRIISLAQELWTATTDLEIGMEANPNNVSVENLSEWRGAGIERVSIGVQSFHSDVLKFLGRDHDGQQARRAIEAAVKIMPRVSADLIYGWTLDGTRQSCANWQEDLDAVLALGVTHISAYQLTIEKDTAFGYATRRGIEKAVDSDLSADLYELGSNVLTKAGFTQYEVSNFALTDDACSRHNRVYWQGLDYIGVGPGAHGRLTNDGVRTATISALKPDVYREHVCEYGHGMDVCDVLSGEDWAQEYVLMGLRITEGISLARYQELSGTPLNADTLNTYIDAGLLQLENNILRATPSGRLVLDRLSHELLLA